MDENKKEVCLKLASAIREAVEREDEEGLFNITTFLYSILLKERIMIKEYVEQQINTDHIC